LFKNSELRLENASHFLNTLKSVLLHAIALLKRFDAALLLPTSVIPRGNYKELEEHLVALQSEELGKCANGIELVAECFVKGDFERSWALIRRFDIDVDEAVISAAGRIGNTSLVDLCKFVLNILPMLEHSSRNTLIEALSAVLRKGRNGDEFVSLLLCEIDDWRDVYQVMKWFGMDESACLVAVLNGNQDDVVDIYGLGRKKGNEKIQQIARRWIAEHNALG
jgi:hypothetical protein